MACHTWRRGGLVLVALAGLLGVLAFSFQPVLAEGPANLDTLTVSLWPEYDKPGVLVIFRGTLPASTRLPATVRFRIPKSGQDVGGTAGVDAEEKFHYYTPTITDVGDALEVSYNTPYPIFQFEYYDTALQVEGQQRTFGFSYRLDHTVSSFVLEAQEPAGSTDFATTPPGEPAADSFGGSLKVRRRNMGPAKAGDSITWEVRYSKGDSRLSAQILGVPTPGTSSFEDAQAQTQGISQQTLLIVGSAVIVVLAALVVLYFTVFRKQPAPQTVVTPSRGKRSRRSRKGGQKPLPAQPLPPRGSPKAQSAPPPKQATPSFCHQCGQPLEPGDTFCSQCGTQRKGD